MVDYDSLAATYERRYEHYRYDGVARELLRFIGARPAIALEVGCGTGHWLDLLQAHGQAAHKLGLAQFGEDFHLG